LVTEHAALTNLVPILSLLISEFRVDTIYSTITYTDCPTAAGVSPALPFDGDNQSSLTFPNLEKSLFDIDKDGRNSKPISSSNSSTY
jgi:hypothetical protein